jgi:hypothetical protein
VRVVALYRKAQLESPQGFLVIRDPGGTWPRSRNNSAGMRIVRVYERDVC